MQERLFHIAPSAIALSMRWEHPGGWELAITVHTVGPDGPVSRTDRYGGLTSEELHDVVDVVLAEELQTL